MIRTEVLEEIGVAKIEKSEILERGGSPIGKTRVEIGNSFWV